MFKIPNILKPQVIFKTTSPISGEIKIVQIGKERRLLVGGYTQSINHDCPGVEKRVWGRIVHGAITNCPNAKKLLLLGLGGGTIVGLLKKTRPGLEITAVEIDKEIIKVADEFFHIPVLSHTGCVKIIKGDAFDFVLSRGDGKKQEGYEIIVVDVYCGGNFPEKFWSREFLTSIINILDGKGCVILNRILDVSSGISINKARDFLLKFFNEVEFEKVNIVGREGNVLFLCRK